MRRTLVTLVALAGCALTSKSEPRELRYFSPQIAEADAVAGAPCGRVRLGRIVANDQLRLPIERRVSAVELVPYDTLRWTERPEVFARRAIARAVYAQPIEQAVGGQGLTLDVELAGFEEVARGGRVALHYAVRDEVRVVATGTIDVERPSRAATIEATVVAIGEALAAASDELARRVVAAACPR